MQKRFVSIWFNHLNTDWFIIRDPALAAKAFVLTAPVHGRMVITAANHLAEAEGVVTGMVAADARAVIPSLIILDDKPGLALQLLKRLANWCIRFTPFVVIDPPEGLILDVTGCAHLWGGEQLYIEEIVRRLESRGYHVRTALADTAGAAWAFARFGKQPAIIEPGEHLKAILSLPPASLRLDIEVIERLDKLGIRKIEDFIHMPRTVLRRRFGKTFLQRVNQVLGYETVFLEPVEPIVPYQERLPCLEPIVTATGIEMALQNLLTTLCARLQKEEKGVREASFRCYRVDGKEEEINISTNQASRNRNHLFKLFELKLPGIEPALGIELFVLTAARVEDHTSIQEKLWEKKAGIEDERITQLLDKLTGKFGQERLHRFLPAEHYWPERSFKVAEGLHEKPVSSWPTGKPRPLQLLSTPQLIMVTAPIPDYPPMLFRYKGQLHKIIKADGPERIEQEWWIADGVHRDYYYVEDETGNRYWLFRSGHYDADNSQQWFIHGFFP